MNKGLRLITMVAMVLVLVTGITLTSCGGEDEPGPLTAPGISVYQYLLGSKGTFDAGVFNSMAEGGGEAGFKFGLAGAAYPSYHFSTATKDAVANAVFPPPYTVLGVKIYKNPAQKAATTFAMIGAGDQSAVLGTIFATQFTAAEQDMVVTAVAGFFNRQENDTAASKAPAATSAYAILKGVSQSAADAWAADVAAGKDLADSFFIRLVRSSVAAYPTQFGLPANPTDAQIDAVSLVFGKSSFTDGTAGSFYAPTKLAGQTQTIGDTTAQAKYGKAYKDLNVAMGEKATVDGMINAALPSAFATKAASIGMTRDALVAVTRDGTAASMAALGYIASTHTTYAACTGVEKATVDQGVSAAVVTVTGSPALEWEYVTFSAVPGAIMGWASELGPALTLDKTICYAALNSSVGLSAAEQWMADVTAGVHPRQAYYRWLAKGGVVAMGAANPLIRLAVGEFSFKIDNTWGDEISLDSLNINFQIKSTVLSATGDMVDTAKMALGDAVYVPKEGIILRLMAPIKQLDMITWLVMSGKDSTTAGKLAANAFDQVLAGTMTWVVTVNATISNAAGETITETYNLTWAPS